VALPRVSGDALPRSANGGAMTDRELMKMALEAVEYFYGGGQTQVNGLKLIEALRAQLAQSEREWVGLTDEERYEIYDKQDGFYFALLEIEAKLKEKNI
jgi:hypothetical protein